jgi:hypothetical protein
MKKDRPEPKKTPPPADVKTKPATPPPAAPEPDKVKSENDRLTIPIGKDGRPDFDAMRDKTKERVRKLVSDPEVARRLGINADAAPAVSVLPPVFVYALLTAVNQLETIIVARITDAPMNVVLPITHFTPEEKQAISEPLDKVLNKYGGALIGRWGDEIGLLVVLTAITMQKVEAVRQAMEKNVTPRATVIPHPSSVPPPAVPPEPAPAPDEPRTDVPPDVFQ